MKQKKVKLATGFNLSKWPTGSPTRIPRAGHHVDLEEIPVSYKTIACQLGIIIAIIFLTYFIAIMAQFAFNDEYLRAITNSQVNDENFATSLWQQAMLKPLSQPWLRLSLALDYKSFGLEPSWYHLVNIILHMASCCYLYLLIFVLARECTPREAQRHLPYWMAFISAALLACHPLTAESVAYVTGRAGTLVACNVFLAIFCFVYAFLAHRRKDMILGYVFSITFLAMGVWSGPEALVAPIGMLSLSLLLKPESLNWNDWFTRRGAEIALALLLVICTPFLLMMGTTKDFSNGLGLPTLPALLYFASQLRALPIYYLRCTVLPIGLSVLPPNVMSKGGDDLVTLLGLMIVCLTVYLIYRHRRNLFACFGLCLFLFGLLPQACIVQPEIASDRRFYLSLAGLCLIIGQYLAPKLASKSKKSYLLLAIPIIFLGSLTIWRNYAWLSEVRFWRLTLKTNAHSAFVHGMLAQALLHSHKNEAAEKEARMAIKTDPYCLPAYFALAQSHLMLKNYPAASKEFTTVLALAKIQHLDTNILYQSELGLAESLVELDRFKEAQPYAAHVLDIDSSNKRANLVMGRCLIANKQPRLALKYLEIGYKQDKMNSFYLEPIAEACLDTGEPRLVANAFGAARMAFKIYPSEKVDYILTKSALEIGMPGEAKETADRLVQRHPDNAKYLYLKSRVAEALGRKQEAEAFKKKALKLNPNIQAEVPIVDARPKSD